MCLSDVTRAGNASVHLIIIVRSVSCSIVCPKLVGWGEMIFGALVWAQRDVTVRYRRFARYLHENDCNLRLE